MSTPPPNPFRGVELKIRSYKCFREIEGGFDEIKPINILIGRNNSGKSTLLELVGFATQQKDTPGEIGDQTPEIVLTKPLESGELKPVFPENVRGGDIGTNHWEYGKQWVGKPITVILPRQGKPQFEKMATQFTHRTRGEAEQKIASLVRNPFSGYRFKRLLASRDILPEAASALQAVAQDGSGATNMVQQFLNRASLPRGLVECELLSELNDILYPDAHFERLLTRQHEANEWEIFLEEKSKGLIPLSRSGSGIKTVILILIMLHLLPAFEKTSPWQYLFGFEELENNLHPALQRRVLTYLRATAAKRGMHFFLTTHSSVFIDHFRDDEAAQIVHVTHDGERAQTRSVVLYGEKKNILEDLDVRASDLLQSNVIVWVEGPSDRVYFNRWIELWTNGRYQEGQQYQCVYYGGRLLAHLKGDRDGNDKVSRYVEILRVNRNVILLGDGDKKNKSGKLNATKRRLRTEIETVGGIAWFTNRREIENYIGCGPIEKLLGSPGLAAVGEFEGFGTYLEGKGWGSKEKFQRTKVEFARSVTSFMEKEDLLEFSDLIRFLKRAVESMAKWNGEARERHA